MRRSPLIWTLLGVAAVSGVFLVKERVQRLENRLHSVQQEIATGRTAIKMLDAEWSYLNRPDRIEAMIQDHLGMAPASSSQYVRLDTFVKRTTPPSDAARSPVVRVKTPADTPSAHDTPPRLRKPPRSRSTATFPSNDHSWLNKILTDLGDDR